MTFLRGLNEGTMSGISALQFTAGQILYLHPFTAPIWIAGLVFFFTRAGKPYRVFGWIYVAVFLLLVLIKSKIYYLAPAYPPLLAGGGIVLERFCERQQWNRLRPAAVGALVIGGLIFVPLSLPVMSLRTTEKYIHTITFNTFENVHELVGDLYSMHGWPERVTAIAEVCDSLPEDEQARTVIYTGSYALAGAVDYFGGEYGLPNAASGDMTYHLWGLPDHPIDNVVTAFIGRRDVDRLRQVFDSVEVAHSVKFYPWDREQDEPFRVFLCRGAKIDLHEIWPETRDWE